MPFKDIKKRRESNKRSYEKNKELWKSTRIIYRATNKDKMKSYYSNYQKERREIINKRNRDRRKNDPEYKYKVNLKGKLWRENNPEKIALMKKKSILKKQYGITLEQYQEMVNFSKGKCYICSKVGSKINYRNGLCIDHDHKTGKNRGLLCNRCNRSIGLLGDNIEILKKAINYLKKYGT